MKRFVLSLSAAALAATSVCALAAPPPAGSESVEPTADEQRTAADAQAAGAAPGWPAFGPSHRWQHRPFPGMRAPRAWSLPDRPDMPEFGQIPEMPDFPAFGEIPQMPDFPAFGPRPGTPDLLGYRGLRGVPRMPGRPGYGTGPSRPEADERPSVELPELPELPEIGRTPSRGSWPEYHRGRHYGPATQERVDELDAYREKSRQHAAARREAMRQMAAQRRAANRYYRGYRYGPPPMPFPPAPERASKPQDAVAEAPAEQEPAAPTDAAAAQPAVAPAPEPSEPQSAQAQ